MIGMSGLTGLTGMTGLTGLTGRAGHSRSPSKLGGQYYSHNEYYRLNSDQKSTINGMAGLTGLTGLTGMTGMTGLVIMETGRSLRETALAMIPFRSGDLCRTVKTGTSSRSTPAV